MNEITLWKDEWVLHCPKCDNIYDIEWFDGVDKLGLGEYRCPMCLWIFIPTAKMFKTHKSGVNGLKGSPYVADESVNAKARRLAR